ncbi:hypothetical protein EAH_00007670 [Eimeria acervulina]|uniref:Uncharacterized protein n=1 Tax=Eimeria acervulina TaxID=5801 RepID=U6GE56_EIMAC|nr:hypothetical protein EAH_00007670 [Eimeria acervulina]CDI78511.1 hypothetical protein EAH_00007670 [Eimeria acervulina]
MKRQEFLYERKEVEILLLLLQIILMIDIEEGVIAAAANIIEMLQGVRLLSLAETMIITQVTEDIEEEGAEKERETEIGRDREIETGREIETETETETEKEKKTEIEIEIEIEIEEGIHQRMMMALQRKDIQTMTQSPIIEEQIEAECSASSTSSSNRSISSSTSSSGGSKTKNEINKCTSFLSASVVELGCIYAELRGRRGHLSLHAFAAASLVD